MRNLPKTNNMVETNKSTASELDGLPDPELKETQDILSEIEKEENNNLDKEPDDAVAKAKADEDAKAKADADKKAADDEASKKGKDGDGEAEGQRNTKMKLMPSYVHEVAVKEKDKAIADLTEKLKIAEAKGSSTEKKATQEEQQALEADITKLAAEHNLAPELVKSLVDLGMKHGGKLPADVEVKLKKFDELAAAQEIQAEETAFNASFDKHVLPLIKSEYGDLPADTVESIREKMKERAYSDEFAKTPYSVIYKGVDDFRSFKRTQAKSSEASRGGFENNAQNNGAESDDASFDNVTDTDIDAMDPVTFDKYTIWAEKKEKAGRSS